MNGGIQHAIEALSDSELQTVLVAFRFFQLHEVADLLEHATLAEDIDEASQDERYAAAIPDDSSYSLDVAPRV